MGKYDEKDGVWRTIRGRRIFIAKGESLGEAMKKSGKFNNNGRLPKREDYHKAKKQLAMEEANEKENKAFDYVYKKPKDEKQKEQWKRKADKATENRIKANKEYNDYMELYDKDRDDSELTWQDKAEKIHRQGEKIREKKSPRDSDYYDTYRNEEEQFSKIKQEPDDAPYEMLPAYKTYQEKMMRLEKNGGSWTGKEYTNDEFMEHLEDANWHTERKMIEEAGLTNKQLRELKNQVRLSSWSANLDKKSTQELIDKVKKEFPAKDTKKTIEDFKAKKQSNNKIDYTKQLNEVEKDLKDLDKSYRKGETDDLYKLDRQSLIDKKRNIENKIKEQSNNKIETENKPFSSIEFEKNLPHEMRWKETYSVNDGKDLYWVTQEPFTNEMLNKYAEEFKKQGRYEKAYITTRDFSGYDYNDDVKRNTMAVIDKKGNINDAGYEKQMNNAGWEYKKQSNNKVDKEYHFAGEELYSDDPHRYDDTIKSAQARKEKFKADENFKKEKHLGWGEYNKDGVPVYDNDIDYKGDFGWANLKTLSDDDLTKALNIQSEEYHKANAKSVGDGRTRNGRMDRIFKNAEVGKYEQGMKKINEEMQKRDMPRYNIYDKKNPNNILASSPTKEMADRQIQDMYKTDISLQKEYGWKELPRYDYRVGKVDENLNEIKETIKRYKQRKGK